MNNNEYYEKFKALSKKPVKSINEHRKFVKSFDKLVKEFLATQGVSKAPDAFMLEGEENGMPMMMNVYVLDHRIEIF